MKRKLRLTFDQLEHDITLKDHILSTPVALAAITGGNTYSNGSSIDDILAYFQSQGFIFEKGSDGNWYGSQNITLDNVTVYAHGSNSTPYYSYGGNYTWDYSMTGSFNPYGYGGGGGGANSANSGQSSSYGTLNSILSGVGITQGTIQNMAEMEDSLTSLKFYKGVKVAGFSLFIASTAINISETVTSYKNGDSGWRDKAIAAGIDVAVGIISISTGGVGFAIGTAYYVLDEAGYIQKWTQDVKDLFN